MLPVAILAGGLATRLRPLTESIPKSLVEVHGEPFLWHQLRLLSSQGIHRVVLCVGHLGNMVRDSAGDGRAFGLQIDYSFDGAYPLGTAGALKQAIPLLGDRFFVLYGDSYLPCDWSAVEHSFKAGRQPGLMTVCRNDNQWDASNVEFADGRIVAYSKKHRTTRMRHIDYGLGVFHRSAFDRVAKDQACDLAALYRELHKEGRLAAHEVRGRFYEIGSFNGILDFQSYLNKQRQIA